MIIVDITHNASAATLGRILSGYADGRRALELHFHYLCDSFHFNSFQFNSIQFNSIQFNSIQFNSFFFENWKTEIESHRFLSDTEIRRREVRLISVVVLLSPLGEKRGGRRSGSLRADRNRPDNGWKIV